MDVMEFRAGPDQRLVLYRPVDTGNEVDPLEIFSAVAADAEKRAGDGEWIVSMTSLPIRHSATAFGRDGSGYETKVTIAVVYGRMGSPADR